MAFKGVQTVVYFNAIDTTDSSPRTGDSANIALYIVKDGGTPASVTNSVSEVDSTNMPGIYKLTLTSTEMNASMIIVAGKSSTANTAITPAYLTTEIDANVTEIGGDTQSATDLKDFADAGYDPATNKVEGVKLVDTTTTNTDMRGTDSALLAASAPANFSSLAISVSGVVDSNLESIIDDIQSATDLKDFADAGYDPATSKVEGVKLVDTTTTNTDMRGTDSALLAASAPANFSSLAISAEGLVTAELGGLSAEDITAIAVAVLDNSFGKKVVSADGTQVSIYDSDGTLSVIMNKTGTGPYTWTPTYL